MEERQINIVTSPVSVVSLSRKSRLPNEVGYRTIVEERFKKRFISRLNDLITIQIGFGNKERPSCKFIDVTSLLLRAQSDTIAW